MRQVSKEERVAIMAVLADMKGNYQEAAKELRIGSALIEWVDIVENRKFNYTEAGRGRRPLWSFIIARRSVFTSERWDNTDELIRKARVAYDRGEVEICTGRDGEFLILYAIPRNKKAKRTKPWFVVE